MQNKKTLILILFIASLFNACTEKESETMQPEKVAFSFAVNSPADENGRTAAADLPAGTSLVISLTNSAGPVLTHHSITILHIGDRYITEPLELAPGRYNITDFLVVNSSSDVLFATPQRNAPLAKIVTHSLPFSIVIGRNQTTNVEMEVVDAQLNQPEDFGYASFNINVVNPLRISVFKTENGRFVLTDAKAFLYQYNADQVYDLAAQVNLLSIKGNPSATYSLVIEKTGYWDYTRSFSYNELMAELGDKPLKVMLTERPMFTSTFKKGGGAVIIGYNASGTIRIDWGNGEVLTKTLEYDPNPDDSTDGGNWFSPSPDSTFAFDSMRITGDLHIITSLSLEAVSDLDLSTITSLENLELYYSSGVHTLNLTQNTRLKALTLDIPIEDIKFPTEHDINHFSLSGDINTHVVDMIVDNIYNNAVAKNIMEGYANLVHLEEPVSAESQNKLDILRDNYNWTD